MEKTSTPSFIERLRKRLSRPGKLSDAWYWMRYHFSGDFIKLLKTVLKGYPWDVHYLYDLEKAKIEEMSRYHEKYHTKYGYRHTIRDMKICMSLIEIFSEQRELFHYTGQTREVPIEGTDCVEIETGDLQYHCDVHVNTRNICRFLDGECLEWGLRHPHELYMIKARKLYFKIREERDPEWWD